MANETGMNPASSLRAAQVPFKPLFKNGQVATSSTAHTADGAYNFAKVPGTTWGTRVGGGSSTADRALLMRMDPHEVIEFVFWGGDADGEISTMKLWGIDEISGDTVGNVGGPGQPAKKSIVEYVARYMATLTLTLGSVSVAADGSICSLVYVDPTIDPSKLAFLYDTITLADESSLTPLATVVLANSANAWASVEFSTTGHLGYIVEFDAVGSTGLWIAGAYRTH